MNILFVCSILWIAIQCTTRAPDHHVRFCAVPDELIDCKSDGSSTSLLTDAPSRSFDIDISENLIDGNVEGWKFDDFIVANASLSKQGLSEDKLTRLSAAFMYHRENSYYFIRQDLRNQIASESADIPQHDSIKLIDVCMTFSVETEETAQLLDIFLNVAQFYSKITISNYPWSKEDFKKIMLLASENDKKIELHWGSHRVSFPIPPLNCNPFNVLDDDRILRKILKMFPDTTEHLN